VNALQLVNTIISQKLRIGGQESDLINATPWGRTVLWAINEIRRELMDDYDWPAYKKTGEISLVADQDTYQLSTTDFYRLVEGDDPLYYDIYDGSTEVQRIVLVDDATFKNHVAEGVDDGIPYIARLFGFKKVQFRYTPTAQTAGTKIYYDYIMETSDLANSADTCSIPDILLILGAAMKLKSQNGDLTQDVVDDYLAAKLKYKNRAGNRKRKLAYRDI
jgi:hypothetical protein